MKKDFTKNQLSRLPRYLYLLENLRSSGVKYISCQTIADSLNLNQEQVRKDIALVSSTEGIPNKGRDINILIKDLETVLGYDSTHNAVLVGVGSLGKAILNYDGFKNYGLNIVGAFDFDPSIIGKVIKGVTVFDSRRMYGTLPSMDASIGIICVPASSAQGVADDLIENGIEAIWNFAPTKLEVNDNVILSNMDMAQSLAILSHQLYLKKTCKREEN